MKQALLKITGRVQGVFFRATAQKEAERLSLTGYAKNLPDGSVEVLVQGDEEDINSFVDWCLEGPAPCSVSDIKKTWGDLQDLHPGFKIL